jgi:hypothetical protein
MGTRDDLLALLPDNTSGDIGADDMRTIVTRLYNISAAVNARLHLLEFETGFVIVAGRWMVDDAGGGSPAAGHVTCDTPDWPDATTLRFSLQDMDGFNRTNDLMNAEKILGQQVDNIDNVVVYTKTGASAGFVDYIELPVIMAKIIGPDLASDWNETMFAFGVSTAGPT